MKQGLELKRIIDEVENKDGARYLKVRRLVYRYYSMDKLAGTQGKPLGDVSIGSDGQVALSMPRALSMFDLECLLEKIRGELRNIRASTKAGKDGSAESQKGN